LARLQNAGIEGLGTTAYTNQATVSGSALQIQATSANAPTTVFIIKAHSENTANIYYGFVSNVTTTTGVVLHPHDGIVMNLNYNKKPIWVISNGTAQRYSYQGMA
jgi:hypothetical protein